MQVTERFKMMTMKTKLIFAAIVLATDLSAQKITKIKGLDSTRHSSQGIMYKKPGHRIEIEGVYNGKDIFVKNSYGNHGIGFCITQVQVNGNITVDEINAPIFKIDLGSHKLKQDDKIKIVIKYKDSCEYGDPLLMNPSVITQKDPSGNNVLFIEGRNVNQSMYVTNPRSGKNYGIKEVLVNGKKVESIQSDIFEINFYKLGILFEEKVKIEFRYEDNCDPFIVNPEAINF
jgi:hypothetical protein